MNGHSNTSAPIGVVPSGIVQKATSAPPPSDSGRLPTTGLKPDCGRIIVVRFTGQPPESVRLRYAPPPSHRGPSGVQ